MCQTSLLTRDHCDDGKRTAEVKRTDKRRIEELREEVGVEESFRRKLVRSL